jgi:hypothetical protein
LNISSSANRFRAKSRTESLNHDAGKFVGFIISELDFKTAVEKYEIEMKARAGEEVCLGVLNTTMLHAWEKVLQSSVMTAGLRKGT